MEDIKVYTLKNDFLEVSILNLGATLYKLKYNEINTVLSYKDISDYKNNSIYLGSMVGQVCNRISNHSFYLNDKKYILDNNESDYCIHGGKINLSNKYWDIEELNENSINPYIILKTTQKDLESGFPGNVDIKVKYILLDSTLRLEIVAKSDKDTIINITNHSYFNLNSNKDIDIKNHELLINSDEYIETDENSIPQKISKVDNTDFDLRLKKSLDILENLSSKQSRKVNGFDHNFILNGDKPAAILNNNDISLRIETSYPSLVVYTGNAISSNIKFEHGLGKTHNGICFEAQYETDFINKEFLPNYIYKKGEQFMEVIEYSFS